MKSNLLACSWHATCLCSSTSLHKNAPMPALFMLIRIRENSLVRPVRSYVQVEIVTMADRGKRCDGKCGCVVPCPGGVSCRCGGGATATSGGGSHSTCPCGAHCGCNPCNCGGGAGAGATVGRTACTCGTGCSCSTCKG